MPNRSTHPMCRWRTLLVLLGVAAALLVVPSPADAAHHASGSPVTSSGGAAPPSGGQPPSGGTGAPVTETQPPGIVLSVVAGTGHPGAGGDGSPATRAALRAPTGVAVDATGDLFVADSGNCRVVEVASARRTPWGQAVAPHRLYSVVGRSCPGPLGAPTGVAVDAAGDLYVAAPATHRVWVVAAHSGERLGTTVRVGHLVAVAGSGRSGLAGDRGPATAASLGAPTGVAVDATGDLFVADARDCVVWEVPAHDLNAFGLAMRAGHIYRVAGSGHCATLGSSPTELGEGGLARDAELSDPTSVAVDPHGNLLIDDRGDNEIREVALSSGTYFGVPIAAGHIGTVAGTAVGTGAYGGDGTLATAPTAVLDFPFGIAVDRSGNLYIADGYSRAVRVVASSTGNVLGMPVQAGTLATVAGPPASAAAPATAPFDPSAVAVDAAGDVYFTDQGTNTVEELRASPAG